MVLCESFLSFSIFSGLIPVVAYISILFVVQYQSIAVPHWNYPFIVDGLLAGNHFLTTLNSTTMNMLVQLVVCMCVFIASQEKCWGVWYFCFTFQRTSRHSLLMHHLIFPQRAWRLQFFSTPSPAHALNDSSCLRLNFLSESLSWRCSAPLWPCLYFPPAADAEHLCVLTDHLCTFSGEGLSITGKGL